MQCVSASRAIPWDYIARLNNPSIAVKYISYGAQTLLGDGFLVYRLYLVWPNVRLIIPFILSTLSSAAVLATSMTIAITATDSATIFDHPFQRYPLVLFALTLVTNSLCTLLIAGKIWWVHRRSSGLGRAGGPNLVTPLVLLIESGALYLFFLILQIALYASGSYASGIAFDALPSVIGIIFSLIVVRVGLGLSPYGAGASRRKETLTLLLQELASGPSDLKTGGSRRLSAGIQECG